MNKYELTVIVRTKEAESLKEKVSGILSKHKVNITTDDHWGNKRLAYEIQGEREGFYLFMNIEATPDSIHKISSDFRLNADIFRYLFVKINDKKSA